MLAKRIIACMDIAEGRVKKGTNFKNLRDAGDPVELGKLYSDQGADELVFLDIMATVENRRTLLDLVTRVAKEINIPFAVGGGIKTIVDIKNLLNAGADKVSIGSAAVINPYFINQVAQEFGSQCIVISVDPKKENDVWKIYIKGGRERQEIDAIEFVKDMESRGAGELLINSLDRDGTKDGYDIELLKAINKVTSLPVIASSGAGKKEHFLEAFRDGKADAALAASLFHYGELDIMDLKKYLDKNNILVRL
jgi:cyclase